MSHKTSLLLARLIQVVCAVALLASYAVTSAAQNDRRGIKIGAGDTGRAGTSQKVALVIGNGAYAASPLKNPVNDARAMAQALRELGFEVIYKENTTREEMKRAVRIFGEKIRGGGVGLFYYAGHGIQVKGVNYLVPVDAKIESEEEVEYECVDAGFVLAQMDAAKNSTNIVILDACRNNPFARSFRSVSNGLAQMDAPSGTLIAYATAPGSVASDGSGANGLYTQELLKNIHRPGLSIEEVFKYVRVSVRSQTQGKQTPWESSSLTGDFYFSRAQTAAADKSSPASAELAAWEGIKNSTNAADFQAYLQNYPDGMFADVARLRSEQLLLPSVEGLMSNYLNFLGGKAAVSQIRTVVRKGEFEEAIGQRKISGAVEVYEKRPGKSFTLEKVGDQFSKEVYDGSQGWIYSSRSGVKDETAINIEFQRRGDAWLYGDLEMLKQLYPKLTVRGKESLEGREVFVVEATPPEGRTETIYFDARSGELRRWDLTLDSASLQKGTTVPTQLFFDDYAEVGGIKTPMTVRQVAGGVSKKITFYVWELKINVPVDDGLFVKPVK
jgi:Caspase domain